MTTLYTFKAGYTKFGVAAAPAAGPMITVVDSEDHVLVNAQAATALVNLAGAYVYSYSGAEGLDLVGLFHTDDTTMDQQDLFSYTPSLLQTIETKVSALPNDPADQSAVEAAIADALSTIGDQFSALSDQVDGLQTLGAGSISWPISIMVGGYPVDGVDVWVSTDEAGANVIAHGQTDDHGVVTFLLDAGTYYAWKQMSACIFTNPESFTVS